MLSVYYLVPQFPEKVYEGNVNQPQTDSSSIGPLKKRACLFDWPEKQHNEICTHIESNINTSAQCFSKLKDQKKIEGENLPQEDDEMDLNEWLCDDYWKKKTNGKRIILRANTWMTETNHAN